MSRIYTILQAPTIATKVRKGGYISTSNPDPLLISNLTGEFDIPPPPESYDSAIVGLWFGDTSGDMADEVGSATMSEYNGPIANVATGRQLLRTNTQYFYTGTDLQVHTPGESWTAMGWATHQDTQGGYLFVWGSSGASRQTYMFTIRLNASGRTLRVITVGDARSSHTETVSTGTYTNNVELFWAVRWDKDTGNIYLRIDDSENVIGGITQPDSHTSSDHDNFIIGSYSTGVGNVWFNGVVRYTMMLSSAVSDANVDSVYSLGPTATREQLKALTFTSL